jgi:PhnB protein
MGKVKPVPNGYHTVTPYMIINNAAAAIAFYKKAFGAKEIMRLADDCGKVRHAEIRIGDSPVMLADEYPEMNMRSAETFGGSPIGLMLYVEDVDALAKQAVDAGAKVIRPVKDQFYGDRTGTFADPFGYQWTIATHKEEVPEKEMQKRFKQNGKPSA